MLSNVPIEYLWALVILVGAGIGFKVLQQVILKYLEYLAQKTENEFDDTLIEIIRNIKPSVAVVVAIYLGLLALPLPEMVHQTINGIFLVAIVYQIVIALSILIDFFVKQHIGSGKPDKTKEAALRIINQITKIILWSVGILFILSNFGVNVTSLIASLGIGGIAIALALQNILGDLFSSLAIYFDKPFAIGDFISTGDISGTVKHIGVKTTRIKSLSGEEIVISNRELTGAQIKNFKRMKERRVAFQVGVTYNTPPAKLKKIPSMIEKIISDIPDTRFGRAHFKELADSALTFEIVYYVEGREYELYMDIQQNINNALITAFGKAKIDFAYPTQTVFVNPS